MNVKCQLKKRSLVLSPPIKSLRNCLLLSMHFYLFLVCVYLASMGTQEPVVWQVNISWLQEDSTNSAE